MQMNSTFVMNRPRTWWLVAFVVAFGALSVSAYFAWKAIDRPDTKAPSPGSSDRGSLNQETVRNTAGGYAFDYPVEWSVTQSGSVTKVTSPNEEVVVSFGLAPTGDLLVASDRFLAILRESFVKLELGGRQLGSTGGHLSMVRTGSAVDVDGEELRFSAVTIEGEQQNIAIAVFAKTTSGPTLSSITNKIVASTRLLSD